MGTVTGLLNLLGGVTLFTFALSLISENVALSLGDGVRKFMKNTTSNRYGGALFGVGVTAICQSSVAVNVVAVGLVESGVLNFFQASSVIIGTNIGTTVTAQIVSLSGTDFNVMIIGSVLAFSGLIIKSLFKNKLKYVGGAFIGLGFVFISLDLISGCVAVLGEYVWFKKLFLVDNPVLLLINGFIVTALAQSSSAVTSIMVLLAGKGVLPFENSVFLILGANVGTCMPVILQSLNKSRPAVLTAVFNLLFNLIGTAVLFLPLCLFKTQVAYFFQAFSGSTERMIANFHTIFNVFVSLIILPILKPLTDFVEKASLFLPFKRKYTKKFVLNGKIPLND